MWRSFMAYFAAARLGVFAADGGCHTYFSSSSEGIGAEEEPEFLAASLLVFEFVASADVLACSSFEDLSF